METLEFFHTGFVGFTWYENSNFTKGAYLMKSGRISLPKK